MGCRSVLCWDAVCAICIRARQKLRCYDFLIDIAMPHKIFGIMLGSMRYKKICAPRGGIVLSVRILEIDAGAEIVAVLYRRTHNKMPTYKEEVAHTEAECVKFRFLENPIERVAHESNNHEL